MNAKTLGMIHALQQRVDQLIVIYNQKIAPRVVVIKLICLSVEGDLEQAFMTVTVRAAREEKLGSIGWFGIIGDNNIMSLTTFPVKYIPHLKLDEIASKICSEVKLLLREGEMEECPVCLEENIIGFAKWDCRHMVCNPCFEQITKQNNSCPLCRRN